MDGTIGDFMRDANKKQQSKKQNPLILSPIALSLAACGAGGDGEVSGKIAKTAQVIDRSLQTDNPSYIHFKKMNFPKGGGTKDSSMNLN